MFGFGKNENEIKADIASGASSLSAVYVSETGLVRTDNQDNVLFSIGHRVFCVADGVGGVADGAHASEIVCREVRMMMQVAEPDFSSRLIAIRNALADANEVIYGLSADARMGSTAAVLLFDPDDVTRAGVVWVGDSRIYRIRHGMPMLLTRDHRLADKNLLTRAVGASSAVVSDARMVDVQKGDRFVICTDGVYSIVSDGRIATYAASGSLESAAERLAAEVVRRGAPDNYTFVLVQA